MKSSHRIFFVLALAVASCSARGGGGGFDPGDGATPGDDASQPGNDSSVVDNDRGAFPDVTLPPEDSGVPPVDNGFPPVDNGFPPVDNGFPPVDNGPPIDVVNPVDVPGDTCSQLCARITTTSGCITDLNGCLSACAMQDSVVPAMCRASYDALLACGRSSPIMCTGTGAGVRFTSCPTQHANFESCITGMFDSGVIDSGVPTTDPTRPCTGTFSGPSRECSWLPGRTFTCTPGRTVTVGCNSTAGTGTLCTSTIGSCSGDPVLRVCPGTSPCSASSALSSADDTCGTCPVVSVTCPSSGSVYVLAGSYSDTTSGSCTPSLR